MTLDDEEGVGSGSRKQKAKRRVAVDLEFKLSQIRQYFRAEILKNIIKSKPLLLRRNPSLVYNLPPAYTPQTGMNDRVVR